MPGLLVAAVLGASCGSGKSLDLSKPTLLAWADQGSHRYFETNTVVAGIAGETRMEILSWHSRVAPGKTRIEVEALRISEKRAGAARIFDSSTPKRHSMAPDMAESYARIASEPSTNSEENIWTVRLPTEPVTMGSTWSNTPKGAMTPVTYTVVGSKKIGGEPCVNIRLDGESPQGIKLKNSNLCFSLRGFLLELNIEADGSAAGMQISFRRRVVRVGSKEAIPWTLETSDVASVLSPESHFGPRDALMFAGEITSIVASPDGKMVAVTASSTGEDDAEVAIVDLSSWQVVQRAKKPSCDFHVAWKNVAELLVVCEHWDKSQVLALSVLGGVSGTEFEITGDLLAFAVRRNGDVLAALRDESEYVSYSESGKKLETTLPRQRFDSARIAFDAKDERLAAWRYNLSVIRDDGSATVAPVLLANVYAAAWRPGEADQLIVAERTRLGIWSAATKKWIGKPLEVSAGSESDINVSADGRWFALHEPGLRLFEIKTSGLHEVRLPDPLQEARVSAFGAGYLVLGQVKGRALFRIELAKPGSPKFFGQLHKVVAGDGDQIAACDESGMFTVWNVSNGAPEATHYVPGCSAIQWLSAGRWRVSGPGELWTISAQTKTPFQPEWSDDYPRAHERLWEIENNDKTLEIWSAGTQPKKLFGVPSGVCNASAASGADRFIVEVYEDGAQTTTIVVFNGVGAELRRRKTGGRCSATLSENGRLAYRGPSKTMVVEDLVSNKKLYVSTHVARPQAISAAGTTVLARHAESLLDQPVFILVDVASKKELARITASIRHAVFLGEDRLVTSDGSSLSLWRVPTTAAGKRPQ